MLDLWTTLEAQAETDPTSVRSWFHKLTSDATAQLIAMARSTPSQPERRRCLLALALTATLAQGQALPEADAYLAKLNVAYENSWVKIKEADQSARKIQLKKYAHNLLDLERKLKDAGKLDAEWLKSQEDVRWFFLRIEQVIVSGEDAYRQALAGLFPGDR